MDQLVVDSDVVAVVMGTDEVRACDNRYPEEHCAVVTLVQPMKGEPPRSFMIPHSMWFFDLSTRQLSEEPYGCCEVGQFYAVALHDGRDGVFIPVGGAQGVMQLGKDRIEPR